MKIRLKTWTSETSVSTEEIEIPDGTVTVEVDVMSDARVKFFVDKDKKPEQK